ncbi:MAG: hypothetical protein SH818_05550 [Saprospiraceae bacterium]|nr:hypothetical protein [Saprospiraceae bacterium]
MKFSLILALVLFLMIAPSCVKNESTQIDIESDKTYFPLQIGKFVEFEADSILFRQGMFLDSVRFFAREEIVSQSMDSLGIYYTILRSQRKKTTEAWLPTATYTARILGQKAIRNESNLFFIKLVFPLTIGSSWNGLAYVNTDQIFDVEGESIEVYQDWESFRIREPAGTFISGTLNFTEVITVLQTDEDNIISRRYAVEKYAKGVGLVYKEMIILDCNATVNDCSRTTLPWRSRATKGYIFRQQVTKYN